LKRVLIVAYYFPPIGGIGAIRMARFAECLPEFGWEPIILAPRNTPQPQDLILPVREDRVVRSRSVELSRLGRAVPGGQPAGAASGSSRASNLRQTIQRAAHRFVFYPDAQIGWYPDAVRKGLHILRDADIDAIYSSSNPITAHLVARTLHRRGRLPWVAELRDPWSDRLGPDHPYRHHAERLQRRLGTEADRVVVPTPTMATHLAEVWGRRIDLVMNGHDLDGVRAVAPPEPVLTHVGSYYPERQNLRAVWQAIRRLRAQGALTRLRFIGDLPPALNRELAEFGLSDLVEATGFVSHHAAMDAMQSSSMLIASGFAGDDPLSLGVIPAKIFEYLASGLPILYVGNPHDDTWHLLADEPGCQLVEPDDFDATARAIRDALEPKSYARAASQHSRRARTETLARILDDISFPTGDD
jgi:glycosyltransferase involved in cell wall biosynthesis